MLLRNITHLVNTHASNSISRQQVCFAGCPSIMLCVVVSDEECVRQGVVFVPASLRQKRRAKEHDDVTGGDNKGKKKEDSGIWDPSTSDDEKSDSDDSMSDLYPC